MPRLCVADKVDAAFTWRNGKTYLFSGAEYWRFSGQQPDPGYPKLISKGFAGIPEQVGSRYLDIPTLSTVLQKVPSEGPSPG